MAIFESQARRKPGTRSNTKLFVSGGAAPAEEWIVDKDLPTLFMYDYGGPGQKEVVLPKGMAVGIKPDPEIMYEKGVKKGVLTVAGKGGAPVVGLAPYNFTRHHDDFLDGNQPSIITREYIELPLFVSDVDAAEVKWGAVYDPNLKNGDFVTFSRDEKNFGKLIKYDESKGHKPTEIVGQVLAMEIDQEPWGWLKWALWDETARREDTMGPQNKSGYDAPGDAGYPFDPDYKDGFTDMDGYLSQYTTNPTGIPGILDGSAKAQTVQETGFSVDPEDAGSVIKVDLGLRNVVEGSIVVYEPNGNTVVSEDKYTVDYARGILRFTVPSENPITGDYIVKFRANFFGTPAGWDFKGAVGAVRILLKF